MGSLRSYPTCIFQNLIFLMCSLNYSRHEPPKAISGFVPAAAMVYTDLQTLQGLFGPSDYGSGVEYADGILNSIFPESDMGLQV